VALAALECWPHEPGVMYMALCPAGQVSDPGWHGQAWIRTAHLMPPPTPGPSGLWVSHEHCAPRWARVSTSAGHLGNKDACLKRSVWRLEWSGCHCPLPTGAQWSRKSGLGASCWDPFC
jgi:hypothetical protein